MTEYVLVDDDGEPLPDHDSYTKENVAHDVASRVAAYGDYRCVAVETVDNEENGAEDSEADDSTTMTETYDFMADDSSNDNEQQFDTVGSMWTLGDHSGVSTQNTTSLQNALQATLDEADEDVDGEVIDVLEDAAGLVEDTSVSSFECSHPDCGLHHSHADHKHDIRSGFDVTEEFASQIEFTPFCHCGVNELAMLMEFYGYINTQVFEDGDRFEAASKLPPEELNTAYRGFEAGVTLSHVIDEHISTPLSLEERDEVEAFFSRRSAIESAANSAPIPQKTQAVITENRDALIEATS